MAKKLKYKLKSIEFDKKEIMKDINEMKKKGWLVNSIFNSPDSFLGLSIDSNYIHILYYKWVENEE